MAGNDSDLFASDRRRRNDEAIWNVVLAFATKTSGTGKLAFAIGLAVVVIAELAFAAPGLWLVITPAFAFVWLIVCLLVWPRRRRRAVEAYVPTPDWCPTCRRRELLNPRCHKCGGELQRKPTG